MQTSRNTKSVCTVLQHRERIKTRYLLSLSLGIKSDSFPFGAKVNLISTCSI